MKILDRIMKILNILSSDNHRYNMHLYLDDYMPIQIMLRVSYAVFLMPITKTLLPEKSGF